MPSTTDPQTAQSPAAVQTMISDGVSISDEMRSALRKLMLHTPTDRKALVMRGDEMIVSIYRGDASSAVVVVFDRRYGNEQGLRTVVLTPVPGTDDFTVAANAFAPGQRRPPSGTGTLYYESLHEVVLPSEKPRVVAALAADPADDPAPTRPAAAAPAPTLFPTAILETTVHEPGVRLETGWYLEFTCMVTKLACGPFATLADMQTWLDVRAALTNTESKLHGGERIFKS